MTDELLPCPFCGDDPTTDASYEVGEYTGCVRCAVWVLGAAKWNHRVVAPLTNPVEVLNRDR